MKRVVGNRRASSRKQRRDQHLLDVTVRAHIATKQRNRKVGAWLCALVLISGSVGGAWYGARVALQKYFWQNPDYALAAIDFKGDGTLTREQAVQAAHLQEGVNIFSVDIAKVRDVLVALPQVERAEVERVLPDKITIQITERKPIAWVAAKHEEDPSSNPKSLLIDRKGVLLKPQRDAADYGFLPVIYGIGTGNFAPGEQVEMPEVKATLDLLRLTADAPERLQVRSVDLSRGYCMIVTDQRNAKITFPLEKIDEQLERFGVLLDHVEESNREIQTVNLLVQRNVPVTFVPLMPVNADDVQPVAASSPLPKAGVKLQTAKTTPSASARKTISKPKPAVRKATPAKTYEPPTPVRKAVPVNAGAQPRSQNG